MLSLKIPQKLGCFLLFLSSTSMAGQLNLTLDGQAKNFANKEESDKNCYTTLFIPVDMKMTVEKNVQDVEIPLRPNKKSRRLTYQFSDVNRFHLENIEANLLCHNEKTRKVSKHAITCSTDREAEKKVNLKLLNDIKVNLHISFIVDGSEHSCQSIWSVS